jgi:endonuclease G
MKHRTYINSITVIFIMIFIAFCFMIFIATNAKAFTCGNHTKHGITSPNDLVELCREGYAVGYSTEKKIPDWVSYYITANEVARKFERSNDFRPDMELPIDQQAQLADYRGSGYDRGHMAPSATMDATQNRMSESFLLTNMTPQLPEFNRQGWKLLEHFIRELVAKRGELVIITGVICAKPYTTIGNGVVVPDYFYKIIFDPVKIEAMAFLVPHMRIKESQFKQFIVSVDTIEKLTGIDFFSELSSMVEIIMESTPAENLYK